MGGFLPTPQFRPPVPPISLGTVGQVLTMLSGGGVGFAAVSGGIAGTYLAFASPAGANNNVNPTGFGAGVGILDVSLASGSANWTGLVAGANKQLLIIANNDANNTLTLNAANSGSSAPNQFRAPFDLALPPQSSVLVVYYTTPAQWIIVP